MRKGHVFIFLGDFVAFEDFFNLGTNHPHLQSIGDDRKFV